eukprot:Gregarina_sp_Pseudo_9__340@NODE_121_length_4132_cov_33_412900_g113_i0_p1_GENE_NODE_121_length_4132_cov_33_412900_g113_i0NODE_121_length_4132_cov_33_412900_g113_i0_p1_ORF_typecomplete_len520_score172_39zfRING_2/PF13639_6/1_6e02zfRING_2/PF13639_6/5_4e11zfrbx1/PF12678_7/7_1e02zfrbx1/PF12678_7/1_3e08zfC3HC4_3/PF13920_6/7_9e08zfC3HC4_2/PF13923_6/2_2e03zfC3HC4_2/PF13923_6/1_3e06zfC3HC4/PF00097_25/1_8e03zfC3HC4/PF00097_25/1_4e06zfRING_11/PF17123_5/3_5e06zfRING_5/PF14634_6/4_7e06ProkRING_4/PF14447_6/8_7
MGEPLQKIHLLPLTAAAARVVLGERGRSAQVFGGELLGELAETPPTGLEARKASVSGALRDLMRSGDTLRRSSFLLCRDGDGDGGWVMHGVVDCFPKHGRTLSPSTDLFLDGDPIVCGLHKLSLVRDLPETETASPASAEESRGVSSAETAPAESSLLSRVFAAVRQAVTLERPADKNRGGAEPCAQRTACEDAELKARVRAELSQSCRVLYKGQFLSSRRQRYLVSACHDASGTELLGPVLSIGVAELHIDIARHETFSKVQMSPLVDTVPSVYRLDLFNDCLRPWLLRHSLQRFAEGDIIEVNGIQFKILRTDPPSGQSEINLQNRPLPASLALGALAESLNDLDEEFLSDLNSESTQRRRIGTETSIFIGSPVLPHWVDILPPQQQQAVRRLPPQLQTYALLRQIGESAPHEIERLVQTFDMMPHSRHSRSQAEIARDAQIRDACSEFLVDAAPNPDSFYCSVCLTEKQTGNAPIVALPCGHQFHHRCVTHWFRRTFACPLCKLNFEHKLLAATQP